MITNPDLARLAEGLGVVLRKHTGGPKGWYDHQSRTISTRRRLSIAEYRSTLAHELAHAIYGDTPRFGRYKVRQERRADRYAANLLLTPSAVEEALIWHQHHRAPAAYDLEVTQHLLNVWLDHNRCPARQRQ